VVRRSRRLVRRRRPRVRRSRQALHGGRRALHGGRRALHGGRRQLHRRPRALHSRRQQLHRRRRAPLTSLPTRLGSARQGRARRQNRLISPPLTQLTATGRAVPRLMALSVPAKARVRTLATRPRGQQASAADQAGAEAQAPRPPRHARRLRMKAPATRSRPVRTHLAEATVHPRTRQPGRRRCSSRPW
jgi:hypothetical protein